MRKVSKSKGSVQDAYLQKAKENATNLRIVLLDGKKLMGAVKAFDAFTLLLHVDPGGADVLVYKSAIAVIGPAKREGQ